MMKLAAALLLLACRPAAGQKPPPKCTRVQMIEGETRSQWILPGEPLPDHWAKYFNKTICDAGPAGLEYNCNVGDVTGIGYYYTAESTQAGYANDILQRPALRAMQKISSWRQLKRRVYDGTPLEGVYPYYAADGRQTTGVTLYTLNEEESEGCKGYMVSFGMVITGYAGGEQFTDATPYRDPWFNNTVGCQYETCKRTGEICKYEDVEDDNDNVVEEADTDTRLLLRQWLKWKRMRRRLKSLPPEEVDA